MVNELTGNWQIRHRFYPLRWYVRVSYRSLRLLSVLVPVVGIYLRLILLG
jgi:hypothetical protein